MDYEDNLFLCLFVVVFLNGSIEPGQLLTHDSGSGRASDSPELVIPMSNYIDVLSYTGNGLPFCGNS